MGVITSYSIHYTKLYEQDAGDRLLFVVEDSQGAVILLDEDLGHQHPHLQDGFEAIAQGA